MPAKSQAVMPQAQHGQIEHPETTDAVGSALRPVKATILCVDDEPDALAVLGWFLTAEGLGVIAACSGAEALLRVEDYLPDVIITDYSMPGMTGLELCGCLRECEKTRAIPIILYTALRLPANSWLYDRVLLKPTDLEVFAAEIHSLLCHAH